MKWFGFTLIELLVVISVIVLLLATLFPVMRSSREQGKTIQCCSNIKQLVLGLLSYETENQVLTYGFYDSPIPPPGGYAGYPEYDRTGWWWFNHIVEYSRKRPDRASVIWCPSRRINNGRLRNNVLCGNYGVNQSICKTSCGRKSQAAFIGTPLRSSDISQPGETLLIVDSGYSLIKWWHATDCPPVSLVSGIEDTAYIPGLWVNKERNFWPGQEQDAINGRHANKTVNVGFADGHISRKRSDDLFVEKANDGYKNLCPLWVPK
jgi:prepilin-type processing-associated H-X9-DG protein/prepilin-type N-terminal cleavage/methylation domain-containing protein